MELVVETFVGDSAAGTGAGEGDAAAGAGAGEGDGGFRFEVLVDVGAVAFPADDGNGVGEIEPLSGFLSGMTSFIGGGGLFR